MFMPEKIYSTYSSLSVHKVLWQIYDIPFDYICLDCDGEITRDLKGDHISNVEDIILSWAIHMWWIPVILISSSYLYECIYTTHAGFTVFCNIAYIFCCISLSLEAYVGQIFEILVLWSITLKLQAGLQGFCVSAHLSAARSKHQEPFGSLNSMWLWSDSGKKKNKHNVGAKCLWASTLHFQLKVPRALEMDV